MDPLDKGYMVAMSCTDSAKRISKEGAALRNGHVAQLVSEIVVAHASLGGSLAGLVVQWRSEGRLVVTLSQE